MKDILIAGDVLAVLPTLPENTIDAVITDPPYFLDKLDHDWDPERIQRLTYGQVVRHLPAGMKFDPRQGRRFYEWYFQVSRAIHRVLKPGGFFFSFSSPRLYHRLTCAVEDAGFLIRDTFLWLYLQNQPKAMSLNHFIERMPLPPEERESLKFKLNGWKTPQIRSCYEPIVVSQKPYEGTLLNNFLKYGVGLFNTNLRIGLNYYPSNILIVDGVEEILDKYFLVSKPSKHERGAYNYHQTVKPVALCEYLILLSTQEGAVVLDPFVGSGTTAVAVKRLRRHYIGIDINPEYLAIARARIENEGDAPSSAESAPTQPKLTLD